MPLWLTATASATNAALIRNDNIYNIEGRNEGYHENN